MFEFEDWEEVGSEDEGDSFAAEFVRLQEATDPLVTIKPRQSAKANWETLNFDNVSPSKLLR